MDIVKHVLSEIKDGNSKFTPISDSKSDMEDFQAIAKLLIHADQQGWLNSIKVHQESRTKNSWYDLVFVQNGLSSKGEQYLNSIAPSEKAAPETQEDIVELKPNFMGLGLNLNALMRWWKKRKL